MSAARRAGAALLLAATLLLVGAAGAAQAVTVRIQPLGGAGGTVTGSGFNCVKPPADVPTGTCEQDLPVGTHVVVTTAADSFSVFRGYYSASPCPGTVSGMFGETCTFDVTAAVTFGPYLFYRYPLSTLGGGTGSGYVTSSVVTTGNPPYLPPEAPSLDCGINLPGHTTCTNFLASLDEVQLTAVPSPGSAASFGSPCAGQTTCTVTILVQVIVPVTFTFVRGVTVAPTGSGGGTVTSTTSGTNVNCSRPAISGDVCRQGYALGGSVTLRATAAPGSVFSGWSGCTSTAGADCTVSGDAVTTVVPTFTLDAATVTVQPIAFGVYNGAEKILDTASRFRLTIALGAAIPTGGARRCFSYTLDGGDNWDGQNRRMRRGSTTDYLTYLLTGAPAPGVPASGLDILPGQSSAELRLPTSIPGGQAALAGSYADTLTVTVTDQSGTAGCT